MRSARHHLHLVAWVLTVAMTAPPVRQPALDAQVRLLRLFLTYLLWSLRCCRHGRLQRRGAVRWHK